MHRARPQWYATSRPAWESPSAARTASLPTLADTATWSGRRAAATATRSGHSGRSGCHQRKRTRVGAHCPALRTPPAYGGGHPAVFDAYWPQPFPDGEQEHPERVRVQLGQLRPSPPGQRVIADRATESDPRHGYAHFAAEVRSNDCVHIIGQLWRCDPGVMFRYFSLLSTHLAVFITTTRWHGSPSPGLLEPGGGGGARYVRSPVQRHCGSHCRGIPDTLKMVLAAGNAIRREMAFAANRGASGRRQVLNSLQRRASSRHCGLPGRARPRYRRLRLDRVDQP